MTIIQSWAAHKAKDKLVPYEFKVEDLQPKEVEIEVLYCGICHSDLSVLNNEWGNSKYPFIPGHEVIGKIVSLGSFVNGFKIGQIVGLGWNCASCMHCLSCISGNQQFCSTILPTIIGHAGGFANRVRADYQWVFPIPDELDKSVAGPLLCGGITVFNPLLINQIKPNQHVGIIGIGGLGHMAIKFAKAWGCEVTAFTHNESKFEDAKKMGADHVASSVNATDIKAQAGQFDLILVTVNVELDWPLWLNALAPKSALHIVGVIPKPISIPAHQLISGQRRVLGSPTGSPEAIQTMLNFAARKGIVPQVEHFPMSQCNEALDYLKEGKARYRIVLDADF